MGFIKKIRATLRLYVAIKKADNAHQKTGERYYVMPHEQKKGRLVIMDRKNFRLLKRKKYIPRMVYIKEEDRYVQHKVFVRDLERDCFYCTGYRDGSKMLTALQLERKRNEYYDWVLGKEDK